MDIGSCKSVYSGINIVKKKNNFKIIVKIIEMGYFPIMSSKNFERKLSIVKALQKEFHVSPRMLLSVTRPICLPE